MTTTNQTMATAGDVATLRAQMEGLRREANSSVKFVRGLQAIGHGIAALVTGAKAFDSTFYGYEWAPDSMLRIGVVAAAVDEAIEMGRDAKGAVKGLPSLAQLAKPAKKDPESDIPEAELRKLPAEAEISYRAFKALQGVGKLASAFITMDAALSGNFGVLGTTDDASIQIIVGIAAAQQGVEGLGNLGTAAGVRGKK